MLEVACRRCERRGRLRIAQLIAEHGPGVLDLRAVPGSGSNNLKVNLTFFNSFSLIITEQTRLDFNSLTIILVD
jgi:hypothetical protein